MHIGIRSFRNPVTRTIAHVVVGANPGTCALVDLGLDDEGSSERRRTVCAERIGAHRRGRRPKVRCVLEPTPMPLIGAPHVT